MKNRDQICRQQIHCLSCPLSVSRTGKDCRELPSSFDKDTAIEDLYAAYCEQKHENERLNAEIKRLREHIERSYEEDYDY